MTSFYMVTRQHVRGLRSRRPFFFLPRRGNRKVMIIGTKVRLYKEDIFNPNPKDPNANGLSRKHILEAVEGSLKRLQTDYIDLYQVLLWILETIGISRKMPSSLIHVLNKTSGSLL